MPDQLEAAIESRFVDGDFKYLFVDEVQNVSGYEEVVNAFNTDGGFSRFSDAATSGRDVFRRKTS